MDGSESVGLTFRYSADRWSLAVRRIISQLAYSCRTRLGSALSLSARFSSAYTDPFWRFTSHTVYGADLILSDAISANPLLSLAVSSGGL